MEETNEMVVIQSYPTGKEVTISKLQFNILLSKGYLTNNYPSGSEVSEWVFNSDAEIDAVLLDLEQNVIHNVRCNTCSWVGKEDDFATDERVCPNCKVGDKLMSGTFFSKTHYKTYSKFNERFGDEYVPDNADEDDEDVYDFIYFLELCNDEWRDDEDLQKTFKTPEKLLDLLISVIDWQHPSTVILEIISDITE